MTATIHNGTGFLTLSRRQFLAGIAALGASSVLSRRLLAAEPAPYSFKHGDFEVTVISDGQLQLPATLLGVDTPEEERAAFLKAAGIGETVTPAVNLTLIKSGNDLILFDTGAGPNMTPMAGKSDESLAAAGVDPAKVTKVVFTHGHPDHIWGTIAPDGSLRFPNAAYYSAANEWDFWMAKDILTKLPEGMHQMATETQRHYGAVKDKVTMLKPGDEVVTGIKVIDTKGHTPGHVSFAVAGGEGLIIVADVIPNPAVYFAHPEWKFGFDAIHEQAIESRKVLLDMAATDKIGLLGYHWPYPGLGHAERKGAAYIYVPSA